MEEKKFMRPGHNWLFKFWNAGDGTRCEKKFNLARSSWEDYRGTGHTTNLQKLQ